MDHIDWFAPDDSFGGHVFYGLECGDEPREDQ